MPKMMRGEAEFMPTAKRDVAANYTHDGGVR